MENDPIMQSTISGQNVPPLCLFKEIKPCKQACFEGQYRREAVEAGPRDASTGKARKA
jgi:hypothetical protein